MFRISNYYSLLFFITFVPMKNALQHISFLFFALSLTLILADCNFIDDAFFHQHVNSKTACSDFNNQGDIAGSVCFEDVLFLKDSKVIIREFFNGKLLFITSKPSFLNSFTSSIWQPPKLA